MRRGQNDQSSGRREAQIMAVRTYGGEGHEPGSKPSEPGKARKAHGADKKPLAGSIPTWDDFVTS